MSSIWANSIVSNICTHGLQTLTIIRRNPNLAFMLLLLLRRNLPVLAPVTTCEEFTCACELQSYAFLTPGHNIMHNGCTFSFNDWFMPSAGFLCPNAFTLWHSNTHTLMIFSFSYAIVSEDASAAETPICGGLSRKRHVYTSVSNQVDIELIRGRIRGQIPKFLVRFEGNAANSAVQFCPREPIPAEFRRLIQPIPHRKGICKASHCFPLLNFCSWSFCSTSVGTFQIAISFWN